MRTLFLLRGAPGSGKSTWISENKFDPYTISADTVRNLVTGPELDCSGKLNIAQNKDNIVWDTILRLVESRMKNGEMIIIDATHYRKGLLNSYKDLIKKYRYRQIIVDFTDVDEQECLERNAHRDEFKVVPEEVIHKMYAVFNKEDKLKEINNSFEVLSPDRAQYLIKFGYVPTVIDQTYKKIIVIPDIHGCLNTLQSALNKVNTLVESNEEYTYFRSDYFYVFLGDYFDRGPDSVGVFQLLNSIKHWPNVMLIEGNHEAWFRYYINDAIDLIKSSSFKNKTMPQFNDFLHEYNIPKKQLKPFMQKFIQCGYLRVDNNLYLFTHGGIPLLQPDLRIHTNQIIRGTGGYSDIYATYDGWEKSYNKLNRGHTYDYFQFHGHRNNTEDGPAFCNNHVFNLCTHVEQGSDMRVGVIDVASKTINIINVLNAEDKSKLVDINPLIDKDSLVHIDNEFLFNSMRKHKYINVKSLNDNVESFNFTRDAFSKGKWDAQTCLARGLFVRDNKIVARGYNKFFNIEKYNGNDLSARRLSYPINVYEKYNGFLGLLSYDSVRDSLFFATKSTTSGDHLNIFKKNFKSIIPNEETQARLKEFIKTHNITFIFEVLDKSDPHIMDIKEDTLILLDIVYNSVEEKYVSYDNLINIANSYGLKVKRKITVINNVEEWNVMLQQLLPSMETDIEGVVIEDTNNFRLKIKCNFYLYWKHIKRLIPLILLNIPVAYIYPQDASVIGFIKNMDKNKLKHLSIPELRRLYMEDNKL